MRKQYHFRKSPAGLQAWDVDKLIALTVDLQAETIPLAAIKEFDQNYWYDAEGDTPSCRSIAEHMRLVHEADLSYPIIICPAGQIMDGMHRVVKSYLEGRLSVQAYRLNELPIADFINLDPADLPYDKNE